MRKCLLVSTLLLITSAAHAGITIGGTRVVYPENKKESSIAITNPDNLDYLVQSWVETEGKVREKAPFLITPPLFRLDAKQNNVLRIIRTGGNLPADRESLFWLNIKAIPSASKQANALQIAVKTRIKLIYRPDSLKGSTPEEQADKLTWSRSGNKLQVTNPSPYVINFNEISVGAKQLENVTWVAPGAVAVFALPAGVNSNQITFKVINDYGSPGVAHQASL